MGRCFRILGVVFLLALSFSVFGQDKAFKAALKKGPGPDGYYHADLSKMAFTKKDLAKYAVERSYLLKNLTEGKVLQFGQYYTAVVSLDFLPLNEAIAEREAELGASGAAAGTGTFDENIKNILREIVKSTVEQDDNGFVKFTVPGYKPFKENDLIHAGRICDFYYYRWNNDGITSTTYYYVTRSGLEHLMLRHFYPNVSSFSSTGEAFLYYKNAKERNGHFEMDRNVRWTGTCNENDFLEGVGFSYAIADDRINCMEGTYHGGDPSGSCKFYSFRLRDLVNQKFPEPVTVDIQPFVEGMAMCQFGGGRISFVDRSYVTKIEDIDDYWVNWSTVGHTDDRTRVLKNYEGGLLTLCRRSGSLGGMDIEFLVDKEGNVVRMSGKTQADFDAFLDDAGNQYDKYLSKVLNPTDVVHPTISLKSKLHYDLSQFPEKYCNGLQSIELLKPALDSYKSRKPSDYTKAILAYDTYKLLDLTSALEIDRNIERSRVLKAGQTASIDKRPMFFGLFWYRPTFTQVTGIAEDTYTRKKEEVEICLADIEKNAQKPANMASVAKAIEAGYDNIINWWADVYKEGSRTYGKRAGAAQAAAAEAYRQEMCEQCYVDGNRSTFPKGYWEGSWFFGEPAQSDVAGKLVLKNGESCEWKYIFDDDEKHINVSGSYDGDYKTESEMIQEILKQCNKRWSK